VHVPVRRGAAITSQRGLCWVTVNHAGATHPSSAVCRRCPFHHTKTDPACLCTRVMCTAVAGMLVPFCSVTGPEGGCVVVVCMCALSFFRCRGTYDSCIKRIGCPDATVDALTQACVESGCSASEVLLSGSWCAPSQFC
jgi:hypothetical protein